MLHSIGEYVWLCFCALLAGGVNALAGGGTLLTFPALLGVLERQVDQSIAGVLANGTSTVALVPASLGSSWGFRREMSHLGRLLVWLMLPSVIGGGIGAWLLVAFPDRFNALIPWLILTAAVLFTLQPHVSRWLTRHASASQDLPDSARPISPRSIAGMMLLQLVIAVYGGYFGAGIGILMLSGLGMMGLTNMHQMNGLKSVLGTTINCVAVAVFIWEGNIEWSYALAMMATSLVGGFVAAHYSRRVSSRYVRWLVVAIGFSLAAWYFAKLGDISQK